MSDIPPVTTPTSGDAISSTPPAKTGTTSQAAEGVQRNISDTGNSISKATATVKALISGEGNIADAALAVKGAVDAAQKITGSVSVTCLTPSGKMCWIRCHPRIPLPLGLLVHTMKLYQCILQIK